jgi:hypothetical protein
MNKIRASTRGSKADDDAPQKKTATQEATNEREKKRAAKQMADAVEKSLMRAIQFNDWNRKGCQTERNIIESVQC